jgi:hypothetical protein
MHKFWKNVLSIGVILQGAQQGIFAYIYIYIYIYIYGYIHKYIYIYIYIYWQSLKICQLYKLQLLHITHCNCSAENGGFLYGENNVTIVMIVALFIVVSSQSCRPYRQYMHMQYKVSMKNKTCKRCIILKIHHDIHYQKHSAYKCLSLFISKHWLTVGNAHITPYHCDRDQDTRIDASIQSIKSMHRPAASLERWTIRCSNRCIDSTNRVKSSHPIGASNGFC